MVRSQDFELTIFARVAVSMMKNCSKKQKTHCEVLSCYYRDDKLTTEEVFQEKIFRPEHTLFIRHRFPSAVFLSHLCPVGSSALWNVDQRMSVIHVPLS